MDWMQVFATVNKSSFWSATTFPCSDILYFSRMYGKIKRVLKISKNLKITKNLKELRRTRIERELTDITAHSVVDSTCHVKSKYSQ